MTERQYRRVFEDGSRGEWNNLSSNIKIVMTNPVSTKDNPLRTVAIMFRDKPKLEYGFYQNRENPKIIRHFERLASNISLDDFLRTWRHVDVVDVVPRGEK